MFWLAFPALAAMLYWSCREKPLRSILNLEKDGVLLLQNCRPEAVLALLPEGYEFLDYRYSITGCALSTFHRDVTSSPYVFKSQQPIYTLICYGSKGKMLSVVPGSHRQTPLVWNSAKIISSEQANAVLFHCDVLHAGVISRDLNRQAVQYKIAHRDDLALLGNLQGIDVNKQEANSVPLVYEWLCRKLSLMFPFLINHVFTRYLQQQDDSWLNRLLLTLFGRSFYNR